MLLIAIMVGLFCAPLISASSISDYSAYRDSIARSDLFAGQHLIRLAYIGSIFDGQYCVFDSLSVIEGMVAPRGQRRLIVAKLDGSRLSIAFNMPIAESALSAPLYCDKDRVYLHGRTSGVPRRTGGEHYNGNCIEFVQQEGKISFELLDVYAYGSSGGTADSVPSKEQRDQEKRDWDEL